MAPRHRAAAARSRIVAAGLIAIVVVTLLGIAAAGSLAIWLVGLVAG